MSAQAATNYSRIETAIAYITNHYKQQPELDEIAAQVHLSPFHFQRLFNEWAGTTPKKFLQYISLQHAKKLLEEKFSLADTASETGLSGTGRLHDLFVSIEGMTPAEYKNGAKNLAINYSFSDCPFGNIMVASTAKGICYMAFHEDEIIALNELTAKFPNAVLRNQSDTIQANALLIFQNDWSKMNEVKLHLRGTAFQLKVWETLLKIPMGMLSTYGSVAEKIGNNNAFRAVGTAIGSNPVAFLIPCHRVIQASGNIGGYMWGTTRKTAILGWEQAKTAANGIIQ